MSECTVNGSRDLHEDRSTKGTFDVGSRVRRIRTNIYSLATIDRQSIQLKDG